MSVLCSVLLRNRVIILILTMLIIVPLLTVSEADISLSLAVQFVHELAVKNEKNPDTYQVSFSYPPWIGLDSNADNVPCPVNPRYV